MNSSEKQRKLKKRPIVVPFRQLWFTFTQDWVQGSTETSKHLTSDLWQGAKLNIPITCSSNSEFLFVKREINLTYITWTFSITQLI
jgi:hypothetical protein